MGAARRGSKAVAGVGRHANGRGVNDRGHGVNTRLQTSLRMWYVLCASNPAAWCVCPVWEGRVGASVTGVTYRSDSILGHSGVSEGVNSGVNTVSSVGVRRLGALIRMRRSRTMRLSIMKLSIHSSIQTGTVT